jgi:general secretion pathway protein H
MRRATSAEAGSDAGFTLIELLIGLSILALAVAIAVPSLSRSRAGLALHSAAYELAAHLRSARAAARATSAEQSVTLDSVAGRYWEAGATTPRQLPARPDVTVPDSERLDGARSRIRFFPDGGASGGRIALHDATGSATVQVDWLTGDVRVALSP